MNSIKLEHPLLCGYTIKVIAKNKMTSVSDFLYANTDFLKKITSLSFREISIIKNDLIIQYGIVPVSGAQYYDEFMSNLQVIQTNIKSFDELLEGGFITGNLYEFCGLSSTGKTQLCKTIALNLSQNHNLETFWIDTKKDFSGLCLQRMLLSKMKSASIVDEPLIEDKIEMILNNIKIEYIYDPFKFVDALKYILGNIKKFDKLKLLIIDSLPSIWFLFQGNNFKNGLSLLSEATNLMRTLADKHHIVIIIINIVTRTISEYGAGASSGPKLKAALGKYWQTVPSTRFLLTKSEEFAETTNSNKTNCTLSGSNCNTQFLQQKYEIKIIKSNQLKTGRYCNFNITNKGVE